MKRLAAFIAASVLAAASETSWQESLSLSQAIEIVKRDNLEIAAADYARQSAAADADIASGYQWGALEVSQDVIRSDHPGNVFGFKLSSREADFGDFGAQEFMNNFSLCSGGDASACAAMYTTPPQSLNYPDAYTFYQTKLSYQVPLYVGGKLAAYEQITRSVEKLRGLEKDEVAEEKIYQIRKAYYDMALLNSSISHFTTILNNIKTLETMAQTMIEEGYAQTTDLLEVQSRRANVERMINEMQSNKQLLYHFISFLLNRTVTAIDAPQEDVPMCVRSDDEVLQGNIDLKKARTGLEITDKMVDAATAGFLPQLGAFAELSTADDSFLGDASDHKAYTVGARLSWNLFNGGVDAAGYEKAKIEHLKMQTQYQLAQKGTALKLHQIRTEIEKHDFEIESLQKELDLASAIYLNYEGRYREHLASMSDVIIKQSEQIEKILALQMAKNKRNERVFALQRLANGVAL